MKEIQTRYDLKDSKSSIELNEKDQKILLASVDEFKLRAITEILEGKLVKRKVPLKGLTHGTIQQAPAPPCVRRSRSSRGSPSRRRGRSSRPSRTARRRSRRRSRATLCALPAGPGCAPEHHPSVEGQDFGIDMQFTNYRSN